MIGLKDQCFGVEVEMTGITREQAATALAAYFATDARYVGGAYDKWCVTDRDGKEWTVMSDSSIHGEQKIGSGYRATGDYRYRVEMVTPKLTYAELPKLQECVRQVRHAGAKANSSCGIHVHVDAANHNRQSLKNLIGIMYSKEDIAFNSINQLTGEKYHSNARSYYQQIRAISDRLCREHGLSVIVQGVPARSVSYIEWLRQSRGQPTFRSLLEADLRDAIRDANDLGHFFLLMEHKGYEIHHGGRLGFRLRGQDRYQYPGRRDPLFTEDGIRAAIQGNLEQIEAGLRPVLPARPAYQPYRKHPRYSGFLALYVHYLYLLGKIEKRQYPPRMTPHLRQAVMRFERYQAQFAFLRENNITTPADMAAFEHRIEETLGRLTKQRTLLNVRKKKRLPLYAALADAEALEPSRALYEEGLTGMEQEFEQYMKAVKLLEDSGIPQEVLKEEKAEVYEQLSEVNRNIRAERGKLKLCREICRQTPAMEQDIQKTEEHQKEVREHEHRRR